MSESSYIQDPEISAKEKELRLAELHTRHDMLVRQIANEEENLAALNASFRESNANLENTAKALENRINSNKMILEDLIARIRSAEARYAEISGLVNAKVAELEQKKLDFRDAEAKHKDSIRQHQAKIDELSFREIDLEQRSCDHEKNVVTLESEKASFEEKRQKTEISYLERERRLKDALASVDQSLDWISQQKALFLSKEDALLKKTKDLEEQVEALKKKEMRLKIHEDQLLQFNNLLEEKGANLKGQEEFLQQKENQLKSMKADLMNREQKLIAYANKNHIKWEDVTL